MDRRLLACAALALVAVACGLGGSKRPKVPPSKTFPSPIFDGLSLGMPRSDVEQVHAIRPALTSAGRNRRVWIYQRPGDYAVELTFPESKPSARLSRIDVHLGPSGATPDQYIGRFERELGPPEVRRRKAVINAYGDQRHDQYDTIWSDSTQYVFLTERVPIGGRTARPVYYLTVKKKEITAKGPPTGYVPPPPPKGEDGKPIEEPIF
jgi:hypothetical protein